MMNSTRKLVVYSALFIIISLSSYFMLEFALKDTIKAWNFAASGASVFFGFAGTTILSALIGFTVTLYTYKNEEKIVEKLGKKPVS